jgi:hypothetical protein
MASPGSPRSSSRRVAASRQQNPKQNQRCGSSLIYLCLAVAAITISLSLQRWLNVYTETSQAISQVNSKAYVPNNLRKRGSNSSPKAEREPKPNGFESAKERHENEEVVGKRDEGEENDDDADNEDEDDNESEENLGSEEDDKNKETTDESSDIDTTDNDINGSPDGTEGIIGGTEVIEPSDEEKASSDTLHAQPNAQEHLDEKGARDGSEEDKDDDGADQGQAEEKGANGPSSHAEVGLATH